MAEAVIEKERFTDAGELVYEFGEEFLVECPKCGSMARVLPAETGAKKMIEKLFAPRKLVCTGCPLRREWQGGQVSPGGGRDWYFRLPLWLRVECCGGRTLWANGERHLDFIEDYVGARLRRRRPNVNRSLASRLPTWIKSAKNRDEILRAVGRLREKLNGKS